MSIQEYIRPGTWVTMRFRKFRVLIADDHTLYTWRTPDQVEAGMSSEAGYELIADERSAVDYLTYNAVNTQETTNALAFLNHETNTIPLLASSVNPPAWCKNNTKLPSTLIYRHVMEVPHEFTHEELRVIEGAEAGFVRPAFDFRFQVDFNVYPAMIPRIPALLPIRLPVRSKADLLWFSAMLRNYNM